MSRYTHLPPLSDAQVTVLLCALGEHRGLLERAATNDIEPVAVRAHARDRLEVTVDLEDLVRAAETTDVVP